MFPSYLQPPKSLLKMSYLSLFQIPHTCTFTASTRRFPGLATIFEEKQHVEPSSQTAVEPMLSTFNWSVIRFL